MKPQGVLPFLRTRELGLCRGLTVGPCGSKNVGEVIAEEKSTLPSSNQACELSGESRSTFLMTFSSDGTKVASTHGDHSVRVTDLQTGKCLHVLTGHPRTPWCIAFHPSSNDILASGCLGGQVRIWDLCGRGSEVWTSSKGLVIASLTFHPVDQVLVFAMGNEIFFWDWSQPEPFTSCKTAHEYEKVRLVKFDPLGQFLYTGIANASTVHAQEQEQANVSYINLPEETVPAEERYHLQRHYQTIVHQIGHRQRDWLGVGGGPRNRNSQPQPSGSGTRVSVERQADLDVLHPRTPPPVHMEGFEEARAYAASVTRQANLHAAPSSRPSRSDNVPIVARLWNEQLSDTSAREERPLAHSQIVVMDNQLTTATSGATNSQVITVQSPSASGGPAVSASSSSSSSSSNNSGSSSSSQRTIPGSSTAFPSDSQRPPRPAARYLRRRRLAVSSPPRSRPSSSAWSRFNPLGLRPQASRFSELNTVQPVTVVSIGSEPTTPTVITTSSAPMRHAFSVFGVTSSGLSSATTPSSGAASVLRSHLTSQLPHSGAFSFSSSSRPVMSVGSPSFPGLQVASASSSGSSPDPPTIPVVPTRFSRSTSSRDGARTTVVQRLRQAEQPQRLASIIESEVRQALDQVRSHRVNISETLHDLDTLQQDLETVSSENESPSTSQASEASAAPAPPPPTTTTTTATSGDSGTLVTDTVNALGAISTELDVRIQQLDHRVTEIQHRLSERMLSTVNSAEPQIAPASPERWEARRQRLRGYLDYLRSRYGFSSNQAQSAAAASAREPPEGASRSEEATNQEPVEDTTARVASSSDRTSRLRQLQEEIQNMRQEMTQRQQVAHRQRDRAWFSLQRRNPVHPHYSVSILDDTINTQNDGLQSAINRAIAGAFMARGESNIANNIVNLTNRIQRWDFSHCNIPDITDSSANVIVPHCKLHNDATCDISQDGQLLAVFIPSHRGFPDDAILAVYSLRPGQSFKQCLYTKSFGPNAITVSLSPLNNYVLVGLASKRIAWVFTTRQMVAQVYQLTTPGAGEDSTQHICDLMHPCGMDVRTYVSVNSARWLSGPGQGIIYGTNRGDLHICRPGYEEREKANSEVGEDSNSIRRNLMQFLGRSVPRTMSAATQTVHRVRRTASTQTEGLGEIDEDSL